MIAGSIRKYGTPTRMKLALAFAVVLAACGPMIPPPGNTGGSGSAVATGSGSALPPGGSAAGSGAVVDPASVAGFPGVFAFGEMKFFLANDLGLKVAADGTVFNNESDPGQPEKWQPMFKITTDGKLVAVQGNALLGAFGPDGTFKSSHGEVAPFKLVGDALVIEDKSLTLDDQGALQGAPAGAQPVRVEGAKDPGQRRAALFVLALAMTQGEDPKSGGAPQP